MQNRRWLKIVIGIVVLAALAVTAGPYVYIHFIKDAAPKALSLDGVSSSTPSTTPTTPTTATSGKAATTSAGAPVTYTLTADSQVGYRVVEVLFGQHTQGVGRTNAVAGTITEDGSAVTAATFTVDMTTLKSDEDTRDRKFKNEIMKTATFPTATFALTQPISLGALPADGVEISANATGDLTLHGVTKSVSLKVTAKRNGNSVSIAGNTDVLFADYGIANPSNGAVTTQDHGLIEFLLVATA